jgi:hypothetical protein
MAVTMKNVVFCDITRCGSCKNRTFRGIYHLHHQGYKNQRTRKNVKSNYQPKHAAKEYYLRRETLVCDSGVSLVGGLGVAGSDHLTYPRLYLPHLPIIPTSLTYLLFTSDLVFLRNMVRLLVTANVSSLPILVTLMMEAIRSSETFGS